MSKAWPRNSGRKIVTGNDKRRGKGRARGPKKKPAGHSKTEGPADENASYSTNFRMKIAAMRYMAGLTSLALPEKVLTTT